MAGNDILLAGLRHTHSLGREGCLILADEIERLNTALAERDATIERLTKVAEQAQEDRRTLRYETACLRERATTAERERDEARAEVERKDAALRLIESWEPATQEITVANMMAAEARAALTAGGEHGGA